MEWPSVHCIGCCTSTLLGAGDTVMDSDSFRGASVLVEETPVTSQRMTTTTKKVRLQPGQLLRKRCGGTRTLDGTGCAEIIGSEEMWFIEGLKAC